MLSRGPDLPTLYWLPRPDDPVTVTAAANCNGPRLKRMSSLLAPRETQVVRKVWASRIKMTSQGH